MNTSQFEPKSKNGFGRRFAAATLLAGAAAVVVSIGSPAVSHADDNCNDIPGIGSMGPRIAQQYMPDPGQYIPVPGYTPNIDLRPILGGGLTIGNIKI
jgi:hypothetical protein